MDADLQKRVAERLGWRFHIDKRRTWVATTPEGESIYGQRAVEYEPNGSKIERTAAQAFFGDMPMYGDPSDAAATMEMLRWLTKQYSDWTSYSFNGRWSVNIGVARFEAGDISEALAHAIDSLPKEASDGE